MRLSLGNSNFKDLRTRHCDFVDKTLIVRDVLEDKATTFLIARPRRFGKTFNLSILRYFFDKRDAEENRKLFEGTLIETALLEDGMPCMNFQGKFPVVFLTLKDVRGTDEADMQARLTLLISELYREHRYVLADDTLEAREKNIYQQLVEEKAEKKHVQTSLRKLTDYLHRFYEEKVIILIDEYDTPLHAAFEKNPPYHEQALVFLRDWLSPAFKDNEHLEKGILTGILRVSLINLFSGVNNACVRTMLSSHFAPYFGFTEIEVVNLFKAAGLEHNITDVKNWYNGYEVGGITLYNPWSIVNCIDEKGQLQPYWLESGGDHGIVGKALSSLPNLEMLKRLRALIENEAIEIEFSERILFAHIEGNENALWSLMFYTGYLKSVGSRQDEEITYVKLMIPNREVRSIFASMIKNWGRIHGQMNSIYDTLLTSLTTGDIAQFKKILERYIEETSSFYDFEYNTEERFYHVFLLGMMVTLRNHFIVDSNKEAGRGRFDIILIPRERGRLGLILELKSLHITSKSKREAVEADETEMARVLSDSAQNALDQIQQQRYRARFTQHHISEAIHMGVSFYGKKVEIKYELLTYSPELRSTATFFTEEHHRDKRRKTLLDETSDTVKLAPDFSITGLQYQPVPGDGHCFYHAVALYLGQDQKTLRQQVADYLETHPADFADFFVFSSGRSLKNYINAMKEGEEWADHIDLEVLMRVINAPIVVIGPNGGIRNPEGLNRFSGEPIFVYYNGYTHYDALLLADDYRDRSREILDYLSSLQSDAPPHSSIHAPQS